MNEAEYLMKNYGDRGGCYPSRPYAEADNTLRDLHNCSYDTKAEFNNCFVLLFFQKPLFRLVPAAVLNLETSEVSNIVRLLKIGFSKVKVKVIAHQVRAENLGLWLT